MIHEYGIVGIGAALVDTEIQVVDEDLQQLKIDKGLMTLCDEATQKRYLQHLREHISSADRACGGSAANSMIAAGLMGTKAFMTCKVANDDDGNLFLAELSAANVGFNQADQQNSGTTGKCLVMITPDAERTMNTCLGISETLSPANVELEPLDQAEYLYIEGYLATSATGLAAAISIREAAEQRNVKITLSLSDPGIVAHFRPQLREMLGNRAHMIFCNEAEALAWTEATSLDEATEKLAKDCEHFAITLGAKGAICWDGNTLTSVTAPQVKAVDTNGAGDMFAGCTLAALNQGQSLEKAAAFGCAGASKVVSQFGPRLRHEEYLELANHMRD